MAEINKLNEFLDLVNAIMDSMRFSIENNKEDVWRFSSYLEYILKYNKLLEDLSKYIKIDTIVDYYNIEKIPSPYDTIAIQQKGYFDSVYTNLSILKAFLENKLGKNKTEIINLKDFFQSNLRKAIFNSPEKEADIQDVIEQLLIGKGFSKGIDYDREKGRIKVSAKEVIPDFILHKLDLALEVKFSNSRNKIKKIIDEINADIQSYSKKYSNILFIVYDIGFIRDEEEFKNDLDNKDNINLIIVKH